MTHHPRPHAPVPELAEADRKFARRIFFSGMVLCFGLVLALALPSLREMLQ